MRKFTEPHCFEVDELGLNYIIPVRLKDLFEEMNDLSYTYDFDTREIHINTEEEEQFHNKFKEYQSLHPCNYMFTEIKTLSRGGL